MYNPTSKIIDIFTYDGVSSSRYTTLETVLIT